MGLHQARGRGRAHRMREKFVLQNHPPAAYLCLLTSLEPGSRLTISLVRNRPLAHRNHALESISSFTRAVSNGTPYSTTGPRSRGSTMALALTPFRLRAGGRKRQARERDGGRVAVGGGSPCILAALVAFRLHGSNSRPEARLAGGDCPSWPRSGRCGNDSYSSGCSPTNSVVGNAAPR